MNVRHRLFRDNEIIERDNVRVMCVRTFRIEARRTIRAIVQTSVLCQITQQRIQFSTVAVYKNVQVFALRTAHQVISYATSAQVYF